MFGYLDIEKGTLEDGQRGLWQTFMCGLCMSTKSRYGNFPRAFISNDVNFFNVLFHSVTQTDVEIYQGRCFSHPLKKRSLLHTTQLTDTLAAANVLLTYWNVYDDVIDDGGQKKKTALRMLKKSYAKARADFKLLDDALCKRYADLRTYEQSGCGSIDRVADSFAGLSADFCRLVLGEQSSGYAETLCYNVGKWIYLIDALDDVAKDVKKGAYNVFVNAYGIARPEQLQEHMQEVEFVMFSSLNRIASSFNDLNLTKYTCILKNVIYESIRNKTKQVLGKYKACNQE